MFKFNKLEQAVNYAEVPQPNPLRWEVLYKKSDTEFDLQTGEFRCKDFFNDIVPRFNGKEGISVYRMNTSILTLNEEGVWVRLSNINDYSLFSTNINNLLKQGDYQLAELGDGKALLLLDKRLFSSTYLVSLATLLIRLSNYGESLTSVKEALSSTSYRIDGEVLKDRGCALANKWLWTIPDTHKKFWFFMGTECNSDTKYMPSNVHNCGVSNWAWSLGEI